MLLPGLDARNESAGDLEVRTILIPGSEDRPGMYVQLTMKEHFRYTTELEVTQLRPGPEGHYRTPGMIVRLYHDAKTAEVISYQQQRLHWHLPMEHLDGGWHELSREKMQLNTFLGEWLAVCLNYGVSGEELPALAAES